MMLKKVRSAMALQAILLDAKTDWEKLEAWLRTPRGQLPMLLVFENTENVLIYKDSFRVRYRTQISFIKSTDTVLY